MIAVMLRDFPSPGAQTSASGFAAALSRCWRTGMRAFNEWQRRRILKEVEGRSLAGLRGNGDYAITARAPALPAGVRIRDCGDADLADVQRIYAHHVLHGSASIEETPPSVDEIAARRAEVLRHGLAFLVADYDGVVVGYSYAAPYRMRPAYRYTIENSVYVADGLHRRGVGRALLAELIARCEQGRWRQMIAVIGDSRNAASIGLHTRLGFRDVGTLRNVGWKFNRWTDSVLMQRDLASGAASAPE
ncbi:MAG: GNAT family N-acetyltransferase [Pseudolabrys sp.]